MLLIPSVLRKVYDFICHAFRNNILPKAWQTTVMTPLPKLSNPQTVNDFRKLSLCSVGYKLFAKLTLNYLLSYLPAIPAYQAGFLPGRSCDDQHFILRRTLEERWNHRQATSFLSLDFRKAFDTVNLAKLPEILLEYGAPSQLINLLISACMMEETQISWQGELTPPLKREKASSKDVPFLLACLTFYSTTSCNE